MALPIRLPLEPMLAQSVPAIPRPTAAGELAYEPKWDGFRCVLARDGAAVTLWSRSRKQLTPYFPELADAALRHLPEQIVLDAEIVVRQGPPGEERLDWDALSQRIHPSAKRIGQRATLTPAELVCFDLLALGDVDLTGLPYSIRRDALVQLLADIPGDSGIHLTRVTDDPDEAAVWFERFEGAGLDGVMIKRTDGVYTPGRRTMLKVKHVRTCEAVVIGYGRSKAGHGVGSLHLGLYAGGVLLPVGGIGALPDAARVQLEALLEPLVLTGLEADAAPAPSDVTRTGRREFVPLRPDLVVEVKFEHLEGDRFRGAAQFVRWRPDRDPASCLLAQVDRPITYDLAKVLA